MENKFKNLIIEVIKQNERYSGNEALLDEIYQDAVIRLGNILDVINDEAIIRGYIERIAKLSIITVAKKNESKRAAAVKKEKVVVETSSKPKDYYSAFSYIPEQVPNKTFSKEKFAEIESEILKLENSNPAKEFVKLYKLRYQTNKSLEEISDELNLSQAQVAEQLFEITALVKRIYNNEVSQV